MSILSKIFRSRPLPKLDVTHPQVVELSKRLRALHAMPLATREEVKAWYVEADRLRENLHIEYRDVYDSLPHEITHYLVDADIRAKDAGYTQYQEKLLADLFSASERPKPNQISEVNKQVEK